MLKEARCFQYNPRDFSIDAEDAVEIGLLEITEFDPRVQRSKSRIVFPDETSFKAGKEKLQKTLQERANQMADDNQFAD